MLAASVADVALYALYIDLFAVDEEDRVVPAAVGRMERLRGSSGRGRARGSGVGDGSGGCRCGSGRGGSGGCGGFSSGRGG